MGVTKNLVLGGSGTIGAPLCKYLNSKGEDVINLDIKEGFDLRYHSLDEFKDVDFVWFLAWEVGGAKYLLNDDYQLQIVKNNTLICANVFGFLEKYKPPFIFTSTQMAAVDNNYGITKILGEAWTNLLRGKIVKFWNVYGWEEPGDKSHVIPDMILKALTSGKIELMTDGEEVRQFIYVDDCIQNLVKFKESNSSILHLTNGNWISINELAQVISKHIPATIIPGTKKGYNNKVDPDPSYSIYTYPTTLDDGIKMIIRNAELYIKGEL